VAAARLFERRWIVKPSAPSARRPHGTMDDPSGSAAREANARYDSSGEESKDTTITGVARNLCELHQDEVRRLSSSQPDDGVVSADSDELKKAAGPDGRAKASEASSSASPSGDTSDHSAPESSRHSGSSSPTTERSELSAEGSAASSFTDARDDVTDGSAKEASGTQQKPRARATDESGEGSSDSDKAAEAVSSSKKDTGPASGECRPGQCSANGAGGRQLTGPGTTGGHADVCGDQEASLDAAAVVNDGSDASINREPSAEASSQDAGEHGQSKRRRISQPNDPAIVSSSEAATSRMAPTENRRSLSLTSNESYGSTPFRPGTDAFPKFQRNDGPRRHMFMPQPPTMSRRGNHGYQYNDQQSGGFSSDTDKTEAMDDASAQGRGLYRCARCGQQKKGHICPYGDVVVGRFRELAQPPPEVMRASQKRSKKKQTAGPKAEGPFNHTDQEFIFLYDHFATGLKERLQALESGNLQPLYMALLEKRRTLGDGMRDALLKPEWISDFTYELVQWFHSLLSSQVSGTPGGGTPGGAAPTAHQKPWDSARGGAQRSDHVLGDAASGNNRKRLRPDSSASTILSEKAMASRAIAGMQKLDKIRAPDADAPPVQGATGQGRVDGFPQTEQYPRRDSMASATSLVPATAPGLTPAMVPVMAPALAPALAPAYPPREAAATANRPPAPQQSLAWHQRASSTFDGPVPARGSGSSENGDPPVRQSQPVADAPAHSWYSTRRPSGREASPQNLDFGWPRNPALGANRNGPGVYEAPSTRQRPGSFEPRGVAPYLENQGMHWQQQQQQQQSTQVGGPAALWPPANQPSYPVQNRLDNYGNVGHQSPWQGSVNAAPMQAMRSGEQVNRTSALPAWPQNQPAPHQFNDGQAWSSEQGFHQQNGYQDRFYGQGSRPSSQQLQHNPQPVPPPQGYQHSFARGNDFSPMQGQRMNDGQHGRLNENARQQMDESYFHKV